MKACWANLGVTDGVGSTTLVDQLNRLSRRDTVILHAEWGTCDARASGAFFIFPLYVELVPGAIRHGSLRLVRSMSGTSPWMVNILHSTSTGTPDSCAVPVHDRRQGRTYMCCTCVATAGQNVIMVRLCMCERRQFLSDARHLGLGHPFLMRSNGFPGNFPTRDRCPNATSPDG